MKTALAILVVSLFSCGQTRGPASNNTAIEPKAPQPEAVASVKQESRVVVGAEQMELYLPFLEGKRVAVVANQTSRVGSGHLVDTLIAKGINIQKVFALEHGFRGEASEGEKVSDSKDAKTGTPIVSLYGKHFKPTPVELADVDAVVFDIQDVGARFYTFLSSMHYIMEACAENGKPFYLLDRPNPNGDYVDGPVLDTAYRSFVGMHPIPIVHGMTLGELAQMIVGEGWIKAGPDLVMEIIPVQNWAHASPYTLPVKPSPNLPNALSIRLYPTLCLFEGTIVSVGRGTDKPFQQWGFPGWEGNHNTTFSPKGKASSPIKPMYDGKVCKGLEYKDSTVPYAINYAIICEAFQASPDKSTFFKPFFDKLAGGPRLREAILKNMKAGVKSADMVWPFEAEIKAFKAKREAYLLYP